MFSPIDVKATIAMTFAFVLAAGAADCLAGTIEPRILSQAESAAVGTARTWHVAPESLTGLPAEFQSRTISEAAARAGPGDTVVIHAGVYRETVAVEQSGTEQRPIRFEAAPGERVVITGADVIRKWRKEPGSGTIFSAPWPHRFIPWNKTGTHPDDAKHRMIGRCEQVFVLGYPLLQVLDKNGLSRGTFFVDLDGKRLYVSPRDGTDLSDDESPLIEASARQLLWRVKGEYVHLRGLHFRYAANMAQHGAAEFVGDHGVIEDCTFESTNSSGATFAAKNLVVRRCVFKDNGQIGFGAAGAHGMRFVDCVVRDNNAKGFDRGWEAGANKLVLCRNVVIERCQFVNNRGHGVWFDIGNENPDVRNCLIADNEDSGIFYEISYGLHAHDNVIIGNGFGETPGGWGAAAGISLSSSPDCVIERNLIVGNREGFNFREQDRTTPRIGDEKEHWIWNHDERIRDNVLALNQNAQVWGWFDTDDNRQWPSERRDPAEKKQGKPAQDVASGYQARGKSGAPAGLTLETLAIRFENNLYDSRPWQGLFVWGVEWKRHKRYAKLADVQAELKLETGGLATEIQFADFHGRDLRVPADSPALKRGCYPRGEIPGVQLGTLSSR